MRSGDTRDAECESAGRAPDRKNKRDSCAQAERGDALPLLKPRSAEDDMPKFKSERDWIHAPGLEVEPVVAIFRFFE